MTRLPAATLAEGLQAYGLYSAWWGGWIPVRLGSWVEERREVIWRQGPAAGLERLVRELDEENDDDVLLGVPQHRPFNGGVGHASVLWARVEGKEQLQRARRLRPLPSLVLQEGTSSRRWLLWALERPAGYFDLRDANRKLAYAIGGVQKHGDPDAVWFPAPGTCLRSGRSRPVPVRVARLTAATYPCAKAVVGRLKEPPDLVPWWERVEARR